MEINRNNYEEYFLDYWEKRLDKNSTELLMSFLESNHDLKEEFWSFENIMLTPDENVNYISKSSFKKPEISEYKNINESNYQHYFVSLVEKDLAGQETADIDDFLSLNPLLHKELDLFKKSVVFPDMTVVFPQKESLKKKEIIKIDFRKAFYWSVSAAASVAVIIIAYMIFTTGANEKYEVVRLIHEKKVDNFRSVVLPESNKIQKKNNYENFSIRKENESPDRNITRPSSDYKIEEMAVVKKVQIQNTITEPNAELHTEMCYSDNLTDYISFIKNNSDLKLNAANNKLNSKDDNINKRFTFWDVAEVGFKGYNVLANKKVDFKTEKDNEGKVTYIALGKSFGYSRSKH
jgi:hypothetical protein